MQTELGEQPVAKRCRLTEAGSARPRILKLNVGGTRFETTRQTLLNEPDSFFSGLAEHGEPEEGSGEVFIDQDPKYFGALLHYMRQNRRDAKLPLDLKRLDCGAQLWRIRYHSKRGSY